MKNKIVLVLVLVLVLGLAAFTPGCSTPQTAAYSAVTATSVTANTALKVYDVLAANGQTTPSQNAAVKDAYEKYQAAMLLVCDAGAVYAATSATNAPVAEAALQQAVANANVTLADLINLIRQYGGKL